MRERWQLVDDVGRPHTGAAQMAADVALLERVAAGGRPILRVYTWAGPALSLGRFQPESDVDLDACARHGVEVVRRPTGGRALLHGADVTYAVALPRPSGAAGSVTATYDRLAGGLVAGLASLGVVAEVARGDAAADGVCFSGMQGADLRVGGRKVCGSAQLQRDGAVLQHGSVLLGRRAFGETDLVPGARRAGETADEARARLVERTVTLAELGVTSEPATVAAALVQGFAAALEVDFGSRVEA